MAEIIGFVIFWTGAAVWAAIAGVLAFLVVDVSLWKMRRARARRGQVIRIHGR